MADGGAGQTYLFDDRQESLSKDQWDAKKTESVCMDWSTYKWIRVGIEKMCSELKQRDDGKETCEKQGVVEALDRVETAARKFGRKRK